MKFIIYLYLFLKKCYFIDVFLYIDYNDKNFNINAKF